MRINWTSNSHISFGSCYEYLSVIVNQKKIGVGFNDIYPIKSMLKILCVNFILGAIFYAIQQMLEKILSVNPIIIAITLGFIWLLSYFCIIKSKILILWQELNSDK